MSRASDPPNNPTPRRQHLATAVDKWQKGQSLQAEAVREMIEATLASEPERYLTPRQLSDLVGYSENTIRNLVSSQAFAEDVHYLKKRGRLFFIWSAVESWLRDEVTDFPDEQRRHGRQG